MKKLLFILVFGIGVLSASNALACGGCSYGYNDGYGRDSQISYYEYSRPAIYTYGYNPWADHYGSYYHRGRHHGYHYNRRHGGHHGSHYRRF